MAAVSIQLTPRSRARWMAAMESLSSWGPQANSQLPPPMAQAPKPIGGEVEVGVAESPNVLHCGIRSSHHTRWMEERRRRFHFVFCWSSRAKQNHREEGPEPAIPDWGQFNLENQRLSDFDHFLKMRDMALFISLHEQAPSRRDDSGAKGAITSFRSQPGFWRWGGGSSDPAAPSSADPGSRRCDAMPGLASVETEAERDQFLHSEAA